MIHFVITWHNDMQEFEADEFDDAHEALRVFSHRERSFMGNDRIEVVMLSGENLDAIRVTHPNFFEKGDLLPDWLAPDMKRLDRER